jgi:metal-responsive CopG/Arc/MetJ family transcriptional regulator
VTTTVKTAISIDKTLYEQAEALAQELNVSRSHLFSIALEQYLRRRQGRRVLAQINAAYADQEDADEQQQLDQMRRSFRRQVEGEW